MKGPIFSVVKTTETGEKIIGELQVRLSGGTFHTSLRYHTDNMKESERLFSCLMNDLELRGFTVSNTERS